MSSNPGMGVMINMLGGNAGTVEAYHKAMGKIIASVRLDTEQHGDGACIIAFHDGDSLTIRDDGRSCCESRYICCDDDLSSFGGASLVSIVKRDGPQEDADYDVHETQFVDVKTSKGDFTLCTHNEHNGYYGGFWIVLEYAEDPPAEFGNIGADGVQS